MNWKSIISSIAAGSFDDTKITIQVNKNMIEALQEHINSEQVATFIKSYFTEENPLPIRVAEYAMMNSMHHYSQVNMSLIIACMRIPCAAYDDQLLRYISVEAVETTSYVRKYTAFFMMLKFLHSPQSVKKIKANRYKTMLFGLSRCAADTMDLFPRTLRGACLDIVRSQERQKEETGVSQDDWLPKGWGIRAELDKEFMPYQAWQDAKLATVQQMVFIKKPGGEIYAEVVLPKKELNVDMYHDMGPMKSLTKYLIFDSASAPERIIFSRTESDEWTVMAI